MHNEIGLLPNCLVKKNICISTLQLYCKREGWKNKIVLQGKGVVGWFVLQCEEYCKKKGICIAIQSVYCKWERLEWLLKIVLQYNYCIAGWGQENCIAIQDIVL